MMKKARCLKKHDGFTIIEVMVALSVLGLAVMGVISMQTTSIGTNAAARVTSVETSLAVQHIETIMALDEGHAWHIDTNGNGTNQDTDDDGEDDFDDDAVPPLVEGVEDHFGLDDTFVDPNDPTSGIVTDNNRTVGDYVIMWNVAVNEPLPNVDTVRITVMRLDNFSNRRVTYDFFRARVF